jgi:M6 family metalloprotease-like protein
MRRFLPVFALFLGGALVAWSAPFGPDGLITEYVQPDGNKITLRVFGDEFSARTESLDGYTVVFDPASKGYFYAVPSGDGKTLKPSAISVGAGPAAALGVQKHLKPDPAEESREALARRIKWERDMQIRERWAATKDQRRAIERSQRNGNVAFAPPSTITTGNKTGLTLLIDFDDDPATVPQAEIIEYLNGDNYTGNGNNGSVKKYYLDNSNNRLNYTNVVTAYIRIPNSKRPKSFYNDPTEDCDAQGNLLIKDALDILKALPNYQTEILPKFSSLTLDGSNRVIACNVLYAGKNSGVWAKGLWPHAWGLYQVGAQELSPGGIKVFNYQITDIGDSLTIGTFSHETGHLLCGFPDIYDYDFDSVGGAGVFCLMNSGGHGKNPSMICAYLKLAAGWATVTDISQSTVSVTSLAATVGTTGYNHFLRYLNPASSGTEYFLVENRHRSGRDASLPASGIAVWHVDELGDHNKQSLNRNTSHQNYEVTLLQADNKWDFQNNNNSGDATDLYHANNIAQGYTNSLTDDTGPSTLWWSGNRSGLNLHSFSTAGANMTLRVGNPNAATIELTSPNGGEAFYPDGHLRIFWYSNIPGNLKIELFKNGAFNQLVSASEANDGSHSWKIPSGLTPGSDYSIRISNVSNSAYEDLSDSPFIILGISAIKDALDTETDPRFAWSTGGNQPWLPQTSTTSDGLDAMQSGPIGHNQKSHVQTALAGPGTVTFWWKVSSQPTFDYLRLLLNGVEQSRISGNTTWAQSSLVIPWGNNTVKWEYIKNGSVIGGSDAGWLDDVVFTPAGNNPPASIAVESLSGTRIGSNSTALAFQVLGLTKNITQQIRIRNTGLANLLITSLSRNGTHAADFTIASQPSATILPGGNSTFEIRFAPSASGNRSARIQITSNDPLMSPFILRLAGSATPTPLEGWRSFYFGSEFANGSAANTADPDRDGVPNLLEYALGSDPSTAESLNPVLSQVVTAGAGRYLQLYIDRRRDDLNYTVEASKNLRDWTEIKTYIGLSTEGPFFTDKVDLNSPGEHTPRFLRVKVSER